MSVHRWRPRQWLQQHWMALLETLSRLGATPYSTTLTVSVVGFALAVPAGLAVVHQNLDAAVSGLDGSTRASVFLRPTVTDERARTLAQELQQLEAVKKVEVITRKQALAEFAANSGFSPKALELENPLPAVLVVTPSQTPAGPALTAELSSLPETDFTELDMAWVQRLQRLVELVRHCALVLGTLLGLSVLVIVGNTLRLAVDNRREEVEITKLFGATDGFIRRPFLWFGALCGFFGALLAALVVGVGAGLLEGSVARVASSYGVRFEVAGLGLRGSAILLVGGASLGLVGAWLAVSHRIRRLEPS